MPSSARSSTGGIYVPQVERWEIDRVWKRRFQSRSVPKGQEVVAVRCSTPRLPSDVAAWTCVGEEDLQRSVCSFRERETLSFSLKYCAPFRARFGFGAIPFDPQTQSLSHVRIRRTGHGWDVHVYEISWVDTAANVEVVR